MRILLTDITDMKPGMHCVAGWCESEQRMVRPMPDGNHWSAALIAQLGLGVGSLIEVKPTGGAHPGSFPHTTEDLDVIAGDIRLVGSANPTEMIDLVPAHAGSLSNAFAGHLRLENVFQARAQKLWVPVGTPCPSLVGITCPKGSIELYQDAFNRFRAVIKVKEGFCTEVEVTVSCTLLKHALATGGLFAAKNSLPSAGVWLLRLGLAREYPGGSGECALMLNGVL